MKRYLILSLAMLVACGDDDAPDLCDENAANVAVAKAVAGIRTGRSIACIGEGGANLATVADADAAFMAEIVELRPDAVVWSACSWMPSQDGQESRGDYPAVGDPPQPAVAIDIGEFRCEETTAQVDLVVLDSINDIVVVETYRCTFVADDGEWALTECRLGSTS